MKNQNQFVQAMKCCLTNGKFALLLFSSILLFASCTENKSKLILQTWKCTKIEGAENFESDLEKLIKDPLENPANHKVTDKEKYFGMYIQVIERIRKNLDYNKSDLMKWTFNQNNELTITNLFNKHSDITSYSDEHLNWKIEKNELIVSGVNSDKNEIYISLSFNKISSKEMILSKSIANKLIKIYFQSYNTEMN